MVVEQSTICQTSSTFATGLNIAMGPKFATAATLAAGLNISNLNTLELKDTSTALESKELFEKGEGLISEAKRNSSFSWG